MTSVLRIITRLNIGGPAQHVTLLTRGLIDAGYRTTLACGYPGPDEGDMEYLCRRAGVKIVHSPHLVREPNLWKDLRARREIDTLIRKLSPDIVHTHTAKAGYLGRMAAHRRGIGCIVHTYHGHTFSEYFERWRGALYRCMERRAADVSSAIVALGPGQARDIVETARIAPAEKVRIIPLGLELDGFLALPVERDTRPYRRDLGLPETGTVVTTVGRMTAIKNYPLFLQMARRIVNIMPDVHFLVVGRGEDESAIREEAGQLGLTDRIVFAGWQSDMIPVYAASDVVVLTSRNEGSPVTLIEAQAAGVAAAATAVGGVPDTVLAGQSARLVPSGDAQGLAQAVIDLLNDPEKRKHFGEAGRRFVEGRFTAQRLIENTAQLYRELLRSNKPPVPRGDLHSS